MSDAPLRLTSPTFPADTPDTGVATSKRPARALLQHYGALSQAGERPKHEPLESGLCLHGKRKAIRARAEVDVGGGVERAGGIKESGGSNGFADTLEKRRNGKLAAPEKLGHPFRAGQILVRASVVDSAGDDECHASASSGLKRGDGCRGDKKARGPERGSFGAAHETARSGRRALNGPAAQEREGGGRDRGIPQIKPRHGMAVGFPHEDESRIARAPLEGLGDIEHRKYFQSAAVERDSRRAERAQYIDHDDGVGIRRTR